MTADECLAKRRELLAKARECERLGAMSIGQQCRIMAGNLALMASNNSEDRAIGAALYEKNRKLFGLTLDVSALAPSQRRSMLTRWWRNGARS